MPPAKLKIGNHTLGYSMGTDARNQVEHVIGPNGGKLTFEDLPPHGTTRWVPRRKAQVVAAVHGGLLSLGQACTRYALTTEEFMSWEEAMHEFGLAGLRATHAQEYGHHTLRRHQPVRASRNNFAASRAK